MINPAVNFVSGHRYIVALRDLRTADGSEIPAPEGFRYYRDDLPSSEARSRPSARRFDSHLRDAAQARDPALGPLPRLGLHGRQRREHRRARMLHMRDDAFARARRHDHGRPHGAGTSPPFASPASQDFTAAAGPEARARGHGTYEVPCYLRARLRAGRPLRSSMPTASRPATATTRRSSTASSPGRGRPGRQRPCGPPSTDTACSARRTRSIASHQKDLAQTTTGSSSAPPIEIGIRIRGPAELRRNPHGPLRLPRARRPPPAGPAERALPRAPDDPPRRLRLELRGLPRDGTARPPTR